MYQFSVGREDFVKEAVAHPGRSIRVVRAGTARAVLENGAVVMRPTIVLRYSISVPIPHGGDVIHDEYVHEELWFADDEGFIDESKSLLEKFRATPSTKKRLNLIER